VSWALFTEFVVLPGAGTSIHNDGCHINVVPRQERGIHAPGLGTADGSVTEIRFYGHGAKCFCISRKDGSDQPKHRVGIV
jgi:hypothetical protein